MAEPFRLAVLASGRGSNLRALLQARMAGDLRADVVGVFSDRPDCMALVVAREHGIATFATRPAEHASREAFDAALFSAVDSVQPDLIVCAGYMRLISDGAVRRLQGKMINIHPSLLPKYLGLRTHARALAAGDREHGASVHAVIPALDQGPVLSQARVPVLPGDDADALSRRVLAREHPLLVQTVRAIAHGELDLQETPARWHGVALWAPLILSSDDVLEPSR